MVQNATLGGAIYTDAAERAAYYVRGTTWIGFEVEQTLYAKMQVTPQITCIH